MPLTMTAPTKHPKSGTYRIRLSIPASLRETASRLYGIKREFTANLKTKDKREALKLAAPALAALQAQLDTVRAAYEGRSRTLSNREIHAIVGHWYKAQTLANEDNPGDGEGWQALLWDLQNEIFPDEKATDYKPDAAMLAEAGQLLVENGALGDTSTIREVARALWKAKIDLAYIMARRASGDYSPDPALAAIPTLSAPLSRTIIPIEDIVKGWARDHGHDPEAKPIPRAFYDRHRTATRLIGFLGHDDAGRVTKADAVRWKESMSGKSLATIANDISEMSAVWRWGISNGKVPQNPFTGILPPKTARNRKATRRPFTEHEACTILAAARLEAGALRWLPWLLASTGARLSEACQGTKEDVLVRAGISFLRIHEDDEERAAGEAQRSVKNEGSERMVPVHSALTAEGFLAYVASLPDGSPLFPDIPPDKMFGQRGTSAQKLVGRWLRNKLKITDKKISPSHSWRHWWIDRARIARMDPEVRNAITGHADDGNESHRYGLGLKQMPERLAEEMAKIQLPDELFTHPPAAPTAPALG